MSPRRTYQVKEVAALSGVSVRALHHYDAIGLLVPRLRSDAGYRLYVDDDLLRLQQIVIGRTLGLSLEAIRRSLDDPGFDRRTALIEQRRALEGRAKQAAAMIRAIDVAIGVLDAEGHEDAVMHAPESEDMSMSSKVDMKTIFDGFDPDVYAGEARERWAGTKAYEASMTRAKSYGEQEWTAVRDEQAADLCGCLRRARGRQGADGARRHGHRREAPPVDRPVVLSVRPGNALGTCRYVAERLPICPEHRRAWTGTHGILGCSRARERGALSHRSTF